MQALLTKINASQQLTVMLLSISFVRYTDSEKRKTMASFASVLRALQQGKSVRLPRWESITKMFVAGGILLCQRGDAKSYPYDLSWYEIAATDWQIIEA
jgi:hypothetical protein